MPLPKWKIFGIYVFSVVLFFILSVFSLEIFTSVFRPKPSILNLLLFVFPFLFSPVAAYIVVLQKLRLSRLVTSLILTSTIFLLSFILFILNNAFKPVRSTSSPGKIVDMRALPTITSKPSTPTPTPGPLKPELIQDSEYSLEFSDESSLITRNGTKVWETLLPFSEKQLIDFFYDPASESLYVVTDTSPTREDSYEEIAKYTYKNNLLDKSLLSFHQPGLYAGTRILKFYPPSTLLLLTRGGDGCGSYGKVWKISGSVVKDIQPFEGGCNSEKYPDFVGFSHNRLYFWMPDYSHPLPEENTYALSYIYSHDPLTGQKKTLLSAGQVPPDSYVAGSNTIDPDFIQINVSGDIVSYVFDLENLKLQQEDLN